MTMKKPAQLSDNLLSMRPRKGKAKPQTEVEATTPDPVQQRTETAASPAPRRRRRLSDKKLQLNLRVNEKSLERFTKLADESGQTFGDLFEQLLDSYEKSRK